MLSNETSARKSQDDSGDHCEVAGVPRANEPLTLINVLVIILSVYVLLALIVDTFLKLPTELSHLLNYIDNAICVFFLVEFLFRFFKSDNKLQFMKWGWIDLLASIPTLDSFRAGRALRLIRLLRILRAFRSAKHLITHLYRSRTKSALQTALLLGVLTVICSSIAILQVETAPNSNIISAEDALWWSYATITTVGYGDRYPVTTEGRLIAAALMTVGVGVFGTITAVFASWLVRGRK